MLLCIFRRFKVMLCVFPHHGTSTSLASVMLLPSFVDSYRESQRSMCFPKKRRRDNLKNNDVKTIYRVTV